MKRKRLKDVKSSSSSEDSSDDSEIDLPDSFTLRQRLLTGKENDILPLLRSSFAPEAKMDKLVVLSIVYAVKKRARLFRSSKIIEMLLKCLQIQQKQDKESGPSSASSVEKGGGEQMLSIHCLIHCLLFLLQDTKEWPIKCFQVLLEDCTNQRVWVDDPECNLFARNVLAVVEAKEEVNDKVKKNVTKKTQDDDEDKEDDEKKEDDDVSILLPRSRYPLAKKQELIDMVLSHFEKRLKVVENENKNMGVMGGLGNSALRNIIVTCTDFAIVDEIRAFAAKHIEKWISNAAMKVPGKDCVEKVAALCTTGSPWDAECAATIIRLKLKATMWLLQRDIICTIVTNRPAFLRNAFLHFISQERPKNMKLSPDNLRTISAIFKRLEDNSSAKETVGMKSSPHSPSKGRASLSSPAVSTHPSAVPSPSVPSSSERRSLNHRSTMTPDESPTLTLHHPGARASLEMAKAIQELALEKELAPVLKQIVRKLFKSLKFEVIDWSSFVQGLMEDNASPKMSTKTPAMQLEWLQLMYSIIWLTLMTKSAALKASLFQASHSRSNAPGRVHRNIALGSRASPHRDAIVLGTQMDRNSLPLERTREEFVQHLAHVQRAAVNWITRIWYNFVEKKLLTKKELQTVLTQLMCFESREEDSKHEMQCLEYCKDDVPVHQETLQGILYLGREKKLIDDALALHILENIMERAYRGHMKRTTSWAGHTLQEFMNTGGLMGCSSDSIQLVDQLLVLAQYPKGILDDQPLWKVLSFWRICVMVLKLSALSVQPLGEYIWNQHATLRALMQVLITGKWKFPALKESDRGLYPAADTKKKSVFEAVRSANEELFSKETEYVLRAQHAPHVLTVDKNLLKKEGIFATNPSLMARTPSVEFITYLKTVDDVCLLGQQFRKSRDPDFLTETLSLCKSENTGSDTGTAGVQWIADIVCNEPDTVTHLPTYMIGELVVWIFECQFAAKSTPTSTSPAAVVKQPSIPEMLSLQVPILLNTLKRSLFDESQSKGAADVIIYFLKRLTAPSVVSRRVSSKLLELLLETDATFTFDDCLDEFSTSMTRPLTIMDESTPSGFEWLLRLSTLPCHETLKPHVLKTLETILQTETAIAPLRACLSALKALWGNKDPAARVPEDTSSFQQHLSLATAIGQLIVTRKFESQRLLQSDDILHSVITSFTQTFADQMGSSAFFHQNSSTFLLMENEVVLFVLPVSPPPTSTAMRIVLPRVVLLGVLELLTVERCIPKECEAGFNALAHFLFYENTKKENGPQIGIRDICDPDSNTPMCSVEHYKKLSSTSSVLLVRAALSSLTQDDVWSLIVSYGQSPCTLQEAMSVLSPYLQEKDTAQASFIAAVKKCSRVAVLHDADTPITVVASHAATTAITFLKSYAELFEVMKLWPKGSLESICGQVMTFLYSFVLPTSDEMEVEVPSQTAAVQSKNSASTCSMMSKLTECLTISNAEKDEELSITNTITAVDVTFLPWMDGTGVATRADYQNIVEQCNIKNEYYERILSYMPFCDSQLPFLAGFFEFFVTLLQKETVEVKSVRQCCQLFQCTSSASLTAFATKILTTYGCPKLALIGPSIRQNEVLFKAHRSIASHVLDVVHAAGPSNILLTEMELLRGYLRLTVLESALTRTESNVPRIKPNRFDTILQMASVNLSTVLQALTDDWLLLGFTPLSLHNELYRKYPGSVEKRLDVFSTGWRHSHVYWDRNGGGNIGPTFNKVLLDLASPKKMDTARQFIFRFPRQTSRHLTDYLCNLIPISSIEEFESESKRVEGLVALVQLFSNWPTTLFQSLFHALYTYLLPLFELLVIEGSDPPLGIEVVAAFERLFRRQVHLQPDFSRQCIQETPGGLTVLTNAADYCGLKKFKEWCAAQTETSWSPPILHLPWKVAQVSETLYVLENKNENSTKAWDAIQTSLKSILKTYREEDCPDIFVPFSQHLVDLFTQDSLPPAVLTLVLQCLLKWIELEPGHVIPQLVTRYLQLLSSDILYPSHEEALLNAVLPFFNCANLVQSEQLLRCLYQHSVHSDSAHMKLLSVTKSAWFMMETSTVSR